MVSVLNQQLGTSIVVGSGSIPRTGMQNNPSPKGSPYTKLKGGTLPIKKAVNIPHLFLRSSTSITRSSPPVFTREPNFTQTSPLGTTAYNKGYAVCRRANHVSFHHHHRTSFSPAASTPTTNGPKKSQTSCIPSLSSVGPMGRRGGVAGYWGVVVLPCGTRTTNKNETTPATHTNQFRRPRRKAPRQIHELQRALQ